MEPQKVPSGDSGPVPFPAPIPRKVSMSLGHKIGIGLGVLATVAGVIASMGIAALIVLPAAGATWAVAAWTAGATVSVMTGGYGTKRLWQTARKTQTEALKQLETQRAALLLKAQDETLSTDWIARRMTKEYLLNPDYIGYQDLTERQAKDREFFQTKWENSSPETKQELRQFLVKEVFNIPYDQLGDDDKLLFAARARLFLSPQQNPFQDNVTMTRMTRNFVEAVNPPKAHSAKDYIANIQAFLETGKEPSETDIRLCFTRPVKDELKELGNSLAANPDKEKLERWILVLDRLRQHAAKFGTLENMLEGTVISKQDIMHFEEQARKIFIRLPLMDRLSLGKSIYVLYPPDTNYFHRLTNTEGINLSQFVIALGAPERPYDGDDDKILVDQYRNLVDAQEVLRTPPQDFSVFDGGFEKALDDHFVVQTALDNLTVTTSSTFQQYRPIGLTDVKDQLEASYVKRRDRSSSDIQSKLAAVQQKFDPTKKLTPDQRIELEKHLAFLNRHISYHPSSEPHYGYFTQDLTHNQNIWKPFPDASMLEGHLNWLASVCDDNMLHARGVQFGGRRENIYQILTRLKDVQKGLQVWEKQLTDYLNGSDGSPTPPMNMTLTQIKPVLEKSLLNSDGSLNQTKFLRWIAFVKRPDTHQYLTPGLQSWSYEQIRMVPALKDRVTLEHETGPDGVQARVHAALLIDRIKENTKADLQACREVDERVFSPLFSAESYLHGEHKPSNVELFDFPSIHQSMDACANVEKIIDYLKDCPLTEPIRKQLTDICTGLLREFSEQHEAALATWTEKVIDPSPDTRCKFLVTYTNLLLSHIGVLNGKYTLYRSESQFLEERLIGPPPLMDSDTIRRHLEWLRNLTEAWATDAQEHKVSHGMLAEQLARSLQSLKTILKLADKGPPVA